MKKVIGIVFASSLLLAACGGGDNNAPANDPANDGMNNNGANMEENMNNEAANEGGEYDLANGEELYVGNCASCHGGELEGGAGPALEGYDFDAVLAAIQNGPGGMPADLVTGSDAEDVAAWVSEQ
ncbi:cytochrome c [Paenalkalicoccus suaedae]|uniref:Cytochrome c n=1 Tax=Paenalkalicoccus suaedae TaxID=2592382 RepID=A0A859FGV8_9BACI|nr:cytochrome c [Paenalkalicoccus suaedae]QKS72281.1 cytochrome c [Paenalkalicoccus suaedae]